MNIYKLILIFFLFILIVLLLFIFNSKEKFNNNKLQIYYINIDKEKDRNQNMINELQKYNKYINYERISAVTPNDISEYNKEQYKIKCNNMETQFACLLSHLKAIHKAYHRNLEYVLICEDDLLFYRIPNYNLIKSAPNDWDLLHLFTLDYNVYYNKDLWVNTPYFVGAVAYIINKKGMKKIIEKFIPNLLYDSNWNNYKIDFNILDGNCVSDYYLYKFLNAYTCTDQFLTINLDIDSTINPTSKGHKDYQIQMKNILDKIYKDTGFKNNEIGFVIKENFNKPNLFSFWTGTNEMSENRKKCFETLKNTEFNVILITPYNLEQWIKKDHPLHKGYKFLSETHKADYLRTYFMNFYGGGYTDIKIIKDSWIESYNKLYENNNYWGIGYKEVGDYGVPLIQEDLELDKIVRSNWDKLIGNGAYIFKPNTSFTNEWYNKMISVMDSIYEDLVKYPSRYPQDVYSYDYKYPLRWAQLLGEIFHPIVYKYHTHILQSLPEPSFVDYR